MIPSLSPLSTLESAVNRLQWLTPLDVMPRHQCQAERPLPEALNLGNWI